MDVVMPCPRGTGKGSRQRIAKLSHLWDTWTLDEGLFIEQRQAKAKARTLAARAKDLKVPSVLLGIQNTINCWKCGKLGHYGQHCRSSNMWVKVGLVKMIGPGTGNRGTTARQGGLEQRRRKPQSVPLTLVARWDPKLRSVSAGILLELMRLNFASSL